MEERRKIIYPGSFDPVTNGHLDLIKRALAIFDEVIVAVAKREEKGPLFSWDERIDLVKKAIQELELKNVTIEGYDSLLIDFCKKKNIFAILRGLRAVADFDYEFQMALTNRKLSPEIETIFFVPSPEYIFLSASLVKEIAKYGGCLKKFVPNCVEKALRNKFSK
ncbi:MAG: pantetheine-phosphate adenylyltransferase [candidate division WOR-3 bacterium]